LLCAGDDESAEFLRQRDFYAATLRQSGHAVEVLPLPGQHHLSVVDVAADTGSSLTRTLLKMMLG